MLGFKWFRSAAIVIAGIELLRRIRKGQFNLGCLRLKDRMRPLSGTPHWHRNKNVAFAARVDLQYKLHQNPCHMVAALCWLN